MGVLIKFLGSFFTWFFNVVVVKFFVFAIIFIVVSEVAPLIIEIFLPSDISDLQSLVSGIPSNIAYFLSIFRIDVAIKIFISAYASRFLIRRIPFVG